MQYVNKKLQNFSSTTMLHNNDIQIMDEKTLQKPAQCKSKFAKLTKRIF